MDTGHAEMHLSSHFTLQTVLFCLHLASMRSITSQQKSHKANIFISIPFITIPKQTNQPLLLRHPVRPNIRPLRRNQRVPLRQERNRYHTISTNHPKRLSPSKEEGDGMYIPHIR